MLHVPMRKQFKESVKISLEFESHDVIAYLLRTRHIDGMPTALERDKGQMRHANRPTYRDAVIETGFNYFLWRKGYGVPFESFGIFIFSDVLGTC